MLREGHWEVEGRMTSDEMRKAIAEHLGWKLYQFNFAMRSWAALREPGFDPGKLDKAAEAFEVGWEVCEHLPFAWDNVPNWPEDLNAMAEVEEVIKASHLWVPYCNTLAMLCGGMHEDDGGLFVSHTDAIGAPASTRAEAALRILSQRRDA